MIFRQSSPNSIAPIFSLSYQNIVANPDGSTASQHRDANYTLVTTATTHREYTAFGAGLPITSHTSDPADALDLSDWPIIKRNAGVDSLVNATFTNSRATSTNWRFDFRTTTGGSAKLPVESAESGSYFAYSYAAVKAIADAMTTNAMWDSSGTRAQTSAIPHEFLTGHVWDGGWGVPGMGGGGRRFMAITPQHLFACGHYQYNPGDVVRFKDESNNIVSRTVLRVVNILSEAPAQGAEADMSITLLSAPLPESIHILPIAGDWCRGIYEVTGTNYKRCQQVWGLCLLNNDGHLNPFCKEELQDETLPLRSFTFEGITFNRHETTGVAGFSAINGMELWSPTSGKFAHNLRGGDSGSPCIIPVADGWAFAGHVSRNIHPSDYNFNDLIALIDARAVAAGEIENPTGYTVTVAPDPTL